MNVDYPSKGQPSGRPVPASGRDSHDTIGILVKIFPKVTETFVLGEILGLERRGLPLVVLSLRRPTDAVFHATTDLVRSPIRYLPGPGWARLAPAVAAHLGLMLRQPLRYLRTAALALGRSEANRFSEFIQAGCLARMARRAGITHLHAHFASEPVGVAELASQMSGITYSISAHAKDIYLSGRAALRRKIRGARFTVTCTEYNRRYLADLAGPDAAVTRMYHGVDLERFCPAHAAGTGARDAPPLILGVGRLREKKGFAVLIEACRLLRDDGLALRCRIVGYGPERACLERLIAEAGLGDVVRLVGKRTHEQLIPLYREAALFVLPCQISGDGDRDGVPNAMLEAMAMELPVVCGDVSGIPEVVEHGVNGLLVPPGDAESVALRIRELIENRGEARRLGRAARLTVAEMFHAERNLDPVVQLLRHACGDQAPGMLVTDGVKKELGYARGR